MRILLAEDDLSQGEALHSWLSMDGYTVDWVKDGIAAQLALDTHQYDCLLLDRDLPRLHGDDVLKALRSKQPELPVLMITAKDKIEDRVFGLDLGANDYLIKPFDLNELSARVRAQLRKTHQSNSQVLEFEDLQLNLKEKQLYLAGTAVNLTAKEFVVLEALMREPQRIFSKDQLESSLYAWGAEIESNAIEVYISQLRKKIGAQRIKTLRGLGYRMQSQADLESA